MSRGGQNKGRTQINVVRRFDPFLGRWIGYAEAADPFAYSPPDEPLDVELGVSQRRARAILDGRQPIRGRRIA